MSLVNWGKCKIYAKDLEAEQPKWLELPTPVEDSTEITTSKGDKKEAKIEGGENEDVKYSRNTYALNFDIRMLKGRKQPIASADGIVQHKYAFMIEPEDPTAIGCSIEKATVSCEETFKTADGSIWKYVADVLKPDSGNQVKWGVVKHTAGDNGAGHTLQFTENVQ